MVLLCLLLFLPWFFKHSVAQLDQQVVDCVEVFEGPNFDGSWEVIFTTLEGESTVYLKDDIIAMGGEQNSASSVIVHANCQVSLWDLGDPFRGWGFTLTQGEYDRDTILEIESHWDNDLSALEVVSLSSPSSLPYDRVQDEDECPDDPLKTRAGQCGCGNPDVDSDGDGALDCNDECPTDPEKKRVGECGCGEPETTYCDCGVEEIDTDGDGTYDCGDDCPTDPNKIREGRCGCGEADIDTDGDGRYDCQDECPDDPDKTSVGECGCGVPETHCPCGVADIDTDSDGTFDCFDECPVDPLKRVPERCGCGEPETDSDNDGTPDCNDECPDDPEKTRPKHCGCGFPETDTDGDGWVDCIDECWEDPDKKAPLQCGCGEPDIDTDDDGVADCIDSCPLSPENGIYCGTLRPCPDPECAAAFDTCRSHFGCYKVMIQNDFWEIAGISSEGQCGGLRDAQPCWDSLHASDSPSNEGFEEFQILFDCVYGCSLLGQCQSDNDCQHGGICEVSEYGGSFCHCTDEYLGSDCSIETDFMVEFQGNNYFWLWSVHNDYYYGEFKTKNRGWTGMQFGDDEESQMFNADPTIGSVLEDGTVVMADLYTPGDAPHDDDSYDLSDISGWFDGVYTHLRFRRLLDTGDYNDIPIRVDDVQRASWAYGQTTLDLGMDYHSLYNRGLIHVIFNEGLSYHEWYSQESSPTNSPVNTPDSLGYDCMATLKEGYVYFHWTIEGTLLRAAFTVNTDPEAWVGIAFSSSSNMVGGDAVISLTDEAMEDMGLEFPVNQFDLVAHPNEAVIDPIPDLISGEREVEDGMIITRFERRLNTGDPDDMIIEVTEASYMLWAYGNSNAARIDIPFYHELDRGFQVVDYGGCSLAEWGPAELNLNS